MAHKKNKEWRAVPIEEFHANTKIPMTEEDLQGLLHFRTRGYYLKNKKGKGSYERKPKHRNKIEE